MFLFVSGYFQNVNTGKSVALSIPFVNMMEGETISGWVWFVHSVIPFHNMSCDTGTVK